MNNFTNYAIALGHSPESYAFPGIIANMERLHKSIEERKADKKDSMYVDPTDAVVKEITDKF
jgi:hypothetical protein